MTSQRRAFKFYCHQILQYFGQEMNVNPPPPNQVWPSEKSVPTVTVAHMMKCSQNTKRKIKRIFAGRRRKPNHSQILGFFKTKHWPNIIQGSSRMTVDIQEAFVYCFKKKKKVLKHWESGTDLTKKVLPWMLWFLNIDLMISESWIVCFEFTKTAGWNDKRRICTGLVSDWRKILRNTSETMCYSQLCVWFHFRICAYYFRLKLTL